MQVINGVYTSANIFTDNVETYALAQIQLLCNQQAFQDCKIRVMPDVHPGRVGTIGFTSTIEETIMPMVVGIDIGCGITIAKLKQKKIEFQKLDTIIRKYTAEKPVYDFIAPGDGFGHTFWIVDQDEDIASITAEFAKMPALYIADGHHRSAAAALVGAEKAKQNANHRGDEEYNYFMAVCFPANQLTIIDYNRVVKDLNGLTPEQFLAALDKNFVVEEKGTEIYKPSGLHNFSLYLGDKWYSLTAKTGTYNDNDPIGVLDVTISSNLGVWRKETSACSSFNFSYYRDISQYWD